MVNASVSGDVQVFRELYAQLSFGEVGGESGLTELGLWDTFSGVILGAGTGNGSRLGKPAPSAPSFLTIPAASSHGSKPGGLGHAGAFTWKLGPYIFEKQREVYIF